MTVKKDALSKPKAKTALKGQSWRKNIMERKYSCRPASIYYTNNNRVQAGGEGGREASIFLDCKMYSFFFAFGLCVVNCASRHPFLT